MNSNTSQDKENMNNESEPKNDTNTNYEKYSLKEKLNQLNEEIIRHLKRIISSS